MKYQLIILFLIVTTSAFAQNLDANNKKLVNAFKKISACGNGNYDDSCTDSLATYNKRFEKLLLQVTSTTPNSLHAKFIELKQLGLHITTSGDGLLRIYSWDDQTGGTMRRYKNVFQYKANGKVGSTLINSEEDDFNYREIHTVAVKGKNFYLIYGIFTGSTALYYHKVKTFTIDGAKLNENAKLIKTKSGIKNGLGYEVDFSASANRDNKLSFEDMYITYNEKSKSFSIPLIAENGRLTPKKIKYQFNGRYFEKI